jgi:hypothetical protein
LRLKGVIAVMLVVGVAPARAQTPTPDPAPVPPPPGPTVVEPAPLTTTETRPQERPRPHKNRHRSPVSITAIHPTFAEEVPRVISRPAGAAVTETRLPVQLAAAKGASSPLVLILVLLLGIGSLVVAALSSVPQQIRHGMAARLVDHRGELAYVCLTLLVGLGVGLLSALAAQ